MKFAEKVLSLLICCILLLTGCQSDEVKIGESMTEESSEVEIAAESSVVANSEIEVAIEKQEYEVESLIPKNTKEKQFDWVIIQYGRKTLKQKDVDEINEYLQLKVDASIAFHIVTLDGYVSPSVLQELYEELDGNMDFVSFGRDLSAFDMKEWKENFVELSGELQGGKLDSFYKTVPEIAWEANKIDDCIYSFSNSTQVYVRGYGFSTEIQEKYGREQLLKLQKANGIKNEDGWKGLYELSADPLCVWSSLFWGIRADASENPYFRTTLGKLTNGFEDNDFVELTDDIQFDIEKGEFVWLPESEKYVEIKNKTKEFYEKGYLTLALGDSLQANLFAGNTATHHEVNIEGEESDSLWVPLFEEIYISNHLCGNDFMYSFVYCQAEDGWEEVLDVMGSDEAISQCLNQYYYDMTISALVYGEILGYYTPRIRDRYEMIQIVYEEAKENPIAGFVFNPLPIQEEWEEYNRKYSAYAGISFSTRVSEEEIVLYEPNFETIDMVWNAYLEMKEEAHVDLVLEEVNRQYKEWKEQQ